MAYKKNDIIRFTSNQPGSHVIRMFGHYQGLTPEDAVPCEYLGRVKAVINDGESYVATTLSGMGFICILNADEISGTVDVSELSEDEKRAYYDRSGFLEAPNVYDNDPSWLDDTMSVKQKCEVVASKAMHELFPNEVMKGFENFGIYDYRKEKYIESLNRSLESASRLSEERQKELKEKRDELESWFRKMRFKEYYTICVGVEDDTNKDDLEYEKTVHEMLLKQFGKEEADKMHDLKPKKVVRNWLVAIDLHFEEVSIMRDISERTHFGLFLGREHKRLDEAKVNFAYECLK